MGEYCFTSLSAQSWQYRDRRKPEVGTMPIGLLLSEDCWRKGGVIGHGGLLECSPSLT